MDNNNPNITAIHSYRHHSGFTLIEMAIMLVLFGIVLVGGINAIRMQSQQSTFESAQADMRVIKDALLGFVAINGRLPCPSVTTLGVVNTGVANCTSYEGQLPWKTLGIKPLDAWGHLYTYRVTQNFTVSIATATPGDITVRNAPGTTDIATTIPVIVVSHGKNGQGALSLNGTPTPQPLANQTAELQ
ncbi:MAG: prepilin-type N-terminal cleavage/methylation domain-containing protein, partial [Magnetococcales bacterium]|nr:prepilin-type N-terminal cleavage/methylation domain-containing protein [Magnetococcales bacterium]